MKKYKKIENTEWKCKKCCWRNPKTLRCHVNPPSWNGNRYEHPPVLDDDCCSKFEKMKNEK